MTPKFIKNISLNSDEKYITWRERHSKTYFYLMTFVAVSFVVGFYGLDIMLQLPELNQLFNTRIITAIFLISNLIISLFGYPSRKQIKLHLFIGYYIVAFYSTTLSYFAGGVQSSYWAGLNFILIFWMTLIPFAWKELFFNALFFVLQYNIILITLEVKVSWVSVLHANAFLGGTLLIGTAVAFFANKSSAIIYNQTRLLEEEKMRSESLLHNILPPSIAIRLKAGEEIIVDEFKSVAILFADIVNFTTLSQNISATYLVNILNGLFSEFDRLAEFHHLEKIKTIGDAYMAASGVPVPSENYIQAAADMALSMLIEAPKNCPIPIEIRIGLHVGPVTAGVIGSKKFIYDLWGDSVNTASRMESHGLPGTIHTTEKVFNILKDEYNFIPRGTAIIKGKGEMKTFILKGKL